MAGIALYRKYRSGSFDEVIGQDHVVRTLATALSSGRLSHAYLFAGPRGVGKTSVARLLARALNCTVSDGTPRPCGVCDMCRAAAEGGAAGGALDLVEIDAASNNGVDDVRALREKIGLAPAAGRYKVYIIDEVHMLSTGAFNALLKTLEEPPAHAVFILATTESHKLPETIISRTQRFNFRPIGRADITRHLAAIAEHEGAEAEPAALEIIASAARGGFRDAIGMLDQMIAGGGPVTADGVRALLGIADHAAVRSLSVAIADGDARAAVSAIADLLDGGAQPGQLITQLVAFWRAVLFAKINHTAAAANAVADPTAAKLADRLDLARIARITDEFMAIGKTDWPRESLELSVIKLAANIAPAVALAPSPTPPTKAPNQKPAASNTPQSAATAAVGGATASSASKRSEAKQEEAALPAALPPLNADLWPKVVAVMKRVNNNLAALLQMYPVDFADDSITIKSRFNFHRDLFMKPQNRNTISEVLKKVYGREVAVNAVTEAPAVTSAAAPTAPIDTNSELTAAALDILGGELL